MKKSLVLLTITSLFLITSCKQSLDKLTQRVLSVATIQFEQLDARLPENSFPKSFENGQCVDFEDVTWWVTGFFPGSLWYVYEMTGDKNIKALAEKNTLKLSTLLEKETDHDVGFQVNCSYGNAYRLTSDPKWLSMIEAGAAKLATRFSPVVGTIRSWNHKKYRYPVIIDNMMNLELLVDASKLFSCDSLLCIAKTHASTTVVNHFREDGSSFHLVDYDPETGGIDHKQTVQGYADNTAWSRGQAWGLYGYTMMYAKTGEETFLDQALKIADYIMPHLPKDGIPYWDFNAPGTPDAVAVDSPGYARDYSWKEGDPVLRDASAGAIMASAFVQLSTLVKDEDKAYEMRAIAEKQVRTLASEEYLAKPGENGNFLLKHSVGNLHGNIEVDVPLTYADYYFLEALVRFHYLNL